MAVGRDGIIRGIPACHGTRPSMAVGRDGYFRNSQISRERSALMMRHVASGK
jgi:hypothetical protein